MKRTALLLMLLACTVLVVLPACGGREVEHKTTIIREPSSSPANVVVKQAPPAPREEIRGVAPSPAYVWVAGHWTWNDAWVWNPGRWELPPERTTAWVPGHWVRTDNGWVWNPGRWQ